MLEGRRPTRPPQAASLPHQMAEVACHEGHLASGVPVDGLMRRIAFLSCWLPFLAYGQSFERHEFTFNGGSGWVTNAPSGSSGDTAVSLGGTYSFHLRRWLALEAGVLTAIDPTGVVGSAAGFFDVHDRYTWIPFGPRVILPLRHDRFELSAGAGGTYEKYTVGNPSPGFFGSPYSAWGGYFKAGPAAALDPGRHIWLGVTPRLIVINRTYQRDRWFVLTGDIGFRF